jgi:hypothetical protein
VKRGGAGSDRSPQWHARQPHALGDAFALGEKDGVVAFDVSAEAAKRELRVDGEPGFHLLRPRGA